MKKVVRYLLSYALPLVAGIGLLIYTFRDQDLSQLKNLFQQAPIGWILLSFFFAFVSHWARAYRWLYLLDPLGYRVKISHSFVAVMTGYFANLLLPRMGEVTRCALLQKTDRVPANVSFGTVITERIIDLFILLGLVILTLVMESARIGQFILNLFGEKANQWLTSLQNNVWAWVLLTAGVVSCFVLLFFIAKRYRHLTFIQKALGLLEGLWAGVLSVRKVKNKPAFFFFTVLIWLMYYLMAYVLFFCHQQTAQLDILAGLSILVLGGLGIAAPVQGGIGAYHFLVMNAFMMYGLPKDFSLSFATFMHTIQTLAVVTLGGLSFIGSLFIKTQSATLVKNSKKV